MKKYLVPALIVAWVVLLLFFISRTQKDAETVKDEKEEQQISENENIIANNKKYIAEIEQLNKMLTECQRAEQVSRAKLQTERTQIIKTLDEKVSNNPNPADKELLRDLSNLAESIRESRRLDTVAR